MRRGTGVGARVVRMRVGVAVVVVCALLTSGCAAMAQRLGTTGAEQRRGTMSGPNGFVPPGLQRARSDEYLRFATSRLEPSSPTNVIAWAERARREPGFRFDASKVTEASLGDTFAKIDGLIDTADFGMLYLMNLWYGYRDQLTPELRAAIESRMVAFKYWYTDPTPAGMVDNRYYWTENHQLLYHAEEYLAGQAFPNATFTNDGKTGAEHRARAAAFIDEWLTQKARFGFTEWHSDVYYQKTAVALLTVVEWVDDPALSERAAGILDLLLFDVALHLQQGNLGATHGRSYMKDKSVATDQDTFGMAKLLFDDTRVGYTSIDDPGAVLFARAQRYRLPAVLLRVAQSRDATVDREHMGVPLDPAAPIEAHPEAPYGYAFDDPKNVPFWWERGALTSWQVVPTTIHTLDQYGLWESDFFSPFKPLVDLTGGSDAAAQAFARALAPQLGFSLLTAVDTYTYRANDVMLSTAQSYRPGMFGEQHHISQATLDETAIVFTQHPKNEPVPNTRWPDEDGYWTGDGSLPRAAQQGAVSFSIYAPAFAPPGPPLERFSYLPYTHAYFPTEHFDEVTQRGTWTFGRKGDGYVALWSSRPVHWRTYTDPALFTHGLTQPFDLVADGGADNTWVTQVGDKATFGSFAAFVDRVSSAAITATPRPAHDGLAGGYDVSYASPTDGTLTFGTTANLTQDGRVVALDAGSRFDNPWSHTPWGADVVRIADAQGGVTIDLTRGTRVAR